MFGYSTGLMNHLLHTMLGVMQTYHDCIEVFGYHGLKHALSHLRLSF